MRLGESPYRVIWSMISLQSPKSLNHYGSIAYLEKDSLNINLNLCMMKNLSGIIGFVMISAFMVSCEKESVQVQVNDDPSQDKAYFKCWYEEGPCHEETAWSFGNRYVAKGNWATYTQTGIFQSDVDLVPIYAGQHDLIGWVMFLDENAPAGKLKIRLKLFDCVEFQHVSECIKIQGYDNPPDKKPIPGKFTTYKGVGTFVSDDGEFSMYEILVDEYPYYGIHLDVNVCCK
jgi:hypothetical protein